MIANHKIESIFSSIGGEFLVHEAEIKRKLSEIDAYLFDWDGVFNDGIKGDGSASPYSEAASAGVNFLRFGHWLDHKNLAHFGILTGQHNPAAIELAKRERFDTVYLNCKNKRDVLSHLKSNFNIDANRVAFFFDDALDLSCAEKCNLRILIRRHASPLFNLFVKKNQFCEYITAHSGGQQGLREACELLLGISGNYDRILNLRMQHTGKYAEYLEEKSTITNQFFQSDSLGDIRMIL